MTWQDVIKTENNNSGFLTFKEGDNKVRIVSEPEPRMQHWLGKRPIPCVGKCKLCADNLKVRTSHMFHVIDRETGEFKIMGTGVTVANAMRELKESDDYSFDSIPDYDITIKRTGLGLDTEYTVLAARNNSELTEEEKTKVADLKPMKDIIKSLNEADLERAEKEPPIDRSQVATDMNESGFETDSESADNVPF